MALIQPFAGFEFRPPKRSIWVVLVLIELGIPQLGDRLLNRSFDGLIKCAHRNHLSSAWEIFDPHVVIIDVGKLQLRVPHENGRIGKVLGDHGPQLLERRSGDRLGPSEA